MQSNTVKLKFCLNTFSVGNNSNSLMSSSDTGYVILINSTLISLIQKM